MYILTRAVKYQVDLNVLNDEEYLFFESFKLNVVSGK